MKVAGRTWFLAALASCGAPAEMEMEPILLDIEAACLERCEAERASCSPDRNCAEECASQAVQFEELRSDAVAAGCSVEHEDALECFFAVPACGTFTDRLVMCEGLSRTFAECLLPPSLFYAPCASRAECEQVSCYELEEGGGGICSLPCASDAACPSNDRGPGICRDEGFGGLCAQRCAADGDCGAGARCTTIEPDGQPISFCVPSA
jgi:hypothetical protein